MRVAGGTLHEATVRSLQRHETDDAYMGFASRSEITASPKELAETGQTGQRHAEKVRRMLQSNRNGLLQIDLGTRL